MANKNTQSVVCNVASQRGNVTNLDSKGYGMAIDLTPAMSSPQFPVLRHEPAKSGLRHERDTARAMFQAATRSGSPFCWPETTGYRRTVLSKRSWANGKQRFRRPNPSRAILAVDSTIRHDAAATMDMPSLAGRARGSRG